MLYRTLSAGAFLPVILILAGLLLASCGEESTTSPPPEYPIHLQPVRSDGFNRTKVYIPQNDFWREIPSGQWPRWDDSAFHLDETPHLIPYEFRILSEDTWEFANRAGGPFTYEHEGDNWTFLTNDTNVTFHATGTLPELRFFFAIFLYVPGEIVEIGGFDPDTNILLQHWGMREADTLGYQTWDLYFEPVEAE